MEPFAVTAPNTVRTPAGAAEVSVHLTERGRTRVRARRGQPLESALGHGEVTVNSARLFRPRRAPEGAFRDFEADIESRARATDVDMVIGSMGGCVSWLAWLPELIDDHHAKPNFLELVSAALDVGELLSARPGPAIQAVVLIDRVRLQPVWSSQLGSRIAEQLIDLFLLTPESTLALVHLGPDANPGADLFPQLTHDPANAPQRTDPAAGFEQWRSSNIWWLRQAEPCDLTQALSA